jgi:hypothetical protein
MKLSLIFIFITAAYVLIFIARRATGTDAQVMAQSYLQSAIILVALLGIRYCVMKIVSNLFPYTIDGDKLLEDYNFQASCNQLGDNEVLELRPRATFGHKVTMFISKNFAVSEIRSANERLRDSIKNVGWSISNVSVADPDMGCYIVKIDGKQIFLSEYQTIDLFCYLMADKGRIDEAEDIDDEIEKYCTGVGLVDRPR